jgi:hypothetical protein
MAPPDTSIKRTPNPLIETPPAQRDDLSYKQMARPALDAARAMPRRNTHLSLVLLLRLHKQVSDVFFCLAHVLV